MCSNTSYHQGLLLQTGEAPWGLEMFDLGGISYEYTKYHKSLFYIVHIYVLSIPFVHKSHHIGYKSVYYHILLVQMLSWSVQHEVALSCQHISTQITWIAESTGEVLTLHMVPSQGDNFVGKLFTNCAVELPVLWVPSYKLKQLTWVLKCLAWQMESKLSLSFENFELLSKLLHQWSLRCHS